MFNNYFRQISSANKTNHLQLSTTIERVNYAKSLFDLESSVEHFYILILNSKLELLNTLLASEGSLNGMFQISLKDIYKTISKHRDSIILIHNHPSGICLPTPPDIIVTDSIQSLCRKTKTNLIDHLIVSKENYFSFKEEKLLS